MGLLPVKPDLQRIRDARWRAKMFRDHGNWRRFLKNTCFTLIFLLNWCCCSKLRRFSDQTKIVRSTWIENHGLIELNWIILPCFAPCRARFIAPRRGAIVQVGSKFDVRPVSVVRRRRLSVSRFFPHKQCRFHGSPLFGSVFRSVKSLKHFAKCFRFGLLLGENNPKTNQNPTHFAKC